MKTSPVTTAADQSARRRYRKAAEKVEITEWCWWQLPARKHWVRGWLRHAEVYQQRMQWDRPTDGKGYR